MTSLKKKCMVAFMKNKIRKWLHDNLRDQSWLAREIVMFNGKPLAPQNFWRYMKVIPTGKWPIWLVLEIERITGLEFTKKDLK